VNANFAGAAVEGRTVTVFGDGSQTRDYVYVGDVVAGFMAAADAEATGAVNIGTGVETSVLDLVTAIGVAAEYAPARTGEVARSCLDVERADDVLDWRAQVPLGEGLERTLAALR
jgi:UDP-glucose 4-epimerase